MKKSAGKRARKNHGKPHPVAKVMRVIDLPEETDAGIVKATLLGHKRAVIENHRGIYVYTEDGLSMSGPEGIISISGRDLEIRRLDGEKMAVEGYITGISYE